jgi:MFS family permease
MRSDEGTVPAATIAGVALATALVPLNSTMIAVALPEIAREFSVSKGRASTLVTLYLVAMLVGQPSAGRLCDLFGARRVATVAAAGFGVFSAAAMFAGEFWVLIVFRGMQAAFASALVPSVQAMLRQLVPDRQRGRAFGVLGSVIGVGAGLGPVIGGLAIAALGWRSIFGVNLPLVVVSLYVLQRRVALPAAAQPDDERADAEADAAGRMLNTVFGAAFLTQALSTLAQYALLLAVPIVLDSRGWSAAWIGAALSLLTVGMVVMGPLGGKLSDAHGRRRPVVAGLTVALAAVVASAAGGDDVPSVLLVVTIAVFGIGLGAATPSVMTAGIEAAPLARVGSASGLLSASRYVGSIASTIVLAAVVGDDGSGLATMLMICAVGLALSVAAARQLPGRLVGAPELVP